MQPTLWLLWVTPLGFPSFGYWFRPEVVASWRATLLKRFRFLAPPSPSI